MCSKCVPSRDEVNTLLKQDRELQSLDYYSTNIRNYDMSTHAILFCERAVNFLLPYVDYGKDNNLSLSCHYTVTIIENHSDIYYIYKLTSEGLYGAKYWEGNWQWKQLKLYTFLSSRVEDLLLLNSLMEEYASLQYSYNEEHFSIVEDLVEGYNNTTVPSCMQDYGDYFESVKHAGSLLTYDNGKVKARAIIWSSKYLEYDDECSEVLDESRGLMDRIYPSTNHTIIKLFKTYARNNNLVCKAYQNYDNRKEVEYNGVEYKAKIELLIDTPHVDGSTSMPYMDTFRFSDGINLNNYEYNLPYTLTNTDGTVDGVVYATCTHCGCSLDEDDVYYDSDDDDTCCSECYYEHNFTCACCGRNYSTDDMLTIQDKGIIVCQSCADNNYVYCNDIDGYVEYDYIITEDKGAYTLEYAESTCYFIDEVDEWYYYHNNYEDRLAELNKDKEEEDE